MLPTAFVLIWTVIPIGGTGGVATHSHEFSSEATCNAARERLMSESWPGTPSADMKIFAICVKK
jgi:hypothetical protein